MGTPTVPPLQNLAAQALAHLSDLLPGVRVGMPISDCD